MIWEASNAKLIPLWRERAKLRGDADAVSSLLKRPELDDEDELYYAVFTAVSRDRPIVGGMVVIPLPVPRDVIERHCLRISGIEPAERVEFVEIVARVDDRYVQFLAERIQADLSKKKGG